MHEMKFSKEDLVSFVWHLCSTVVHVLEIPTSSVEGVVGVELSMRLSTLSFRMSS